MDGGGGNEIWGHATDRRLAIWEGCRSPRELLVQGRWNGVSRANDKGWLRHSCGSPSRRVRSRWAAMELSWGQLLFAGKGPGGEYRVTCGIRCTRDLSDYWIVMYYGPFWVAFPATPNPGCLLFANLYPHDSRRHQRHP